MNQEEIEGMIGVERFLYEFGGTEPIEYQYHVGEFELTDLILDKMGFPKDTTVELGIEKGFCRDYLCDIIWDLNLSKKTAYRMLVGEFRKLEDDKKRA